MKIYKNLEIILSKDEEFKIVEEYIKKYPDVVKKMVDNLNSNKSLHCPFPNECKRFPCDKLHCNADVCSNGFAYRMS